MDTPMQKFSLEAPYQPSGDQPAAIAKLVQGLNNGVKNQTVIGATGTGKSVVSSTKIILNANGRYYHVPIGVLADKFAPLPESVDVTQYIPLEKNVQTVAFDTEQGKVFLGKVKEISRHRYQGLMYNVTTDDGRRNTFTDSHNVFVLREGSLLLLKSEDLKVGDRVPVPILTPPSPTTTLQKISVLEWVDKNPLIRIKNHSMATSDCHETLTLEGFNKLKTKNPEIEAHTVGFLKTHCDFPVNIELTPEWMRFVGLFIAEGCILSRGIAISSGDETLVEEIRAALNQVGKSLKKSKSRQWDYYTHGKVLSGVMSNWCGLGAHNKHLPSFWPQLDDYQLGKMLSGVFAGDGSAERDHVSLSSVSYELVSDIQLALSRFGILSRIRVKKGVYKENIHLSWLLTVSGKTNCNLFRQKIGFGLPRKDSLLDKLCDKETSENTNVDTVPLPIEIISKIMSGCKISHKKLAKIVGASRSLIGFYLNNKRKPSRQKAKKIAQYLTKVAEKNGEMEIAKVLSQYSKLANVAWSSIASIETYHDDTEVYDLSVPEVQTFLANGYFVHNTFTAAHVIAATNRPTIVMAPNKTLAAQLYNELKSFFPNNAVEFFVSYYDYYQPEAYIPSSDTFVDKDAQINEQIEQMRLSATKSLMERKDVIVVSSVSSIYGLGDPKEFFKMTLQMKVGDKIEQRDLLQKMVNLQYSRNDVELKRATFRVRGEIVDVFPADHEKNAVRIELFDGEIESIHLIDPLTGKIGKKLLSYTLFPKSHYVTTRQRTLEAVETIKQELKERLEELRNENKLVEAQRLEQRTLYDLEMILEVGYCNGIENYSRHLSQQKPGDPPPTLFSYLPDDALLVVDESHVTVPQVGGMYKADRSRKQTLVDYGFRLPSAKDNRPLCFEEWEARIPQTIFVSATPGTYELDHTDKNDIADLVVRPTGLLDPVVEVRPQPSQVDDLLGEIKKRVAVNERVLVTTLTKKMSENLTDYLSDNKIKVRYLHSEIDTIERMEILRDLRLGEFDVLVGINLLREGLDLPEVSLVAILDADKEGFLRSSRSLIQTIGRAARNANGKAILYADKITDSMKSAMEETERRREKQIAYNKEHGITPKTIVRRVADLMENTKTQGKEKPKKKGKVFDDESLLFMPNDRFTKEINKMEKQMLEHAKNLEFEEAGAMRDRIEAVKKRRLEVA